MRNEFGIKKTEECGMCRFFFVKNECYILRGVSHKYQYDICRKNAPPFPTVLSEDWCGQYEEKGDGKNVE